MKVCQDGADFYRDDMTDEELDAGRSAWLWSAPPGTVKHDYDMEGAREARRLFRAQFPHAQFASNEC